MPLIPPFSAAEWALFDLRSDHSSSKLGIIALGYWVNLDNHQVAAAKE
jgi:hypothetical protein